MKAAGLAAEDGSVLTEFNLVQTRKAGGLQVTVDELRCKVECTGLSRELLVLSSLFRCRVWSLLVAWDQFCYKPQSSSKIFSCVLSKIPLCSAHCPLFFPSWENSGCYRKESANSFLLLDFIMSKDGEEEAGMSQGTSAFPPPSVCLFYSWKTLLWPGIGVLSSQRAEPSLREGEKGSGN